MQKTHRQNIADFNGQTSHVGHAWAMNIQKNQEYPPHLDPWVLKSKMQKAVRRGHVEHALNAAMALAEHYPSGLASRIATIALEDIGPANRPLLVNCLSQLAYNRNDAHAVAAWVKPLAQSVKSRFYCDCQHIMAHHLKLKLLVQAIKSQPEQHELDRDNDSILFRGAVCFSWPWKKLSEHVSDKMPQFAEVMMPAHRLGVEGMERMVPALPSFVKPVDIKLLRLPEPELFNGHPDYSYDMHTRVGLRAIRAFTSRHLQAIKLPYNEKLEVVKDCLFALETGLLDQEAIFSFHDELLRLSLEASRTSTEDCEKMSVWKNLVAEKLPKFFEMRREFISGSLTTSYGSLKNG